MSRKVNKLNRVLNILLIEDSEDDAILLLRELKRGGYDVNYKLVETENDMSSAIDNEEWDIIITDYNMPEFSAPGVLKVVKNKKKDIPVIIISGAIGEEAAAEIMRQGARDYIKKENWARLIPAIEREVNEKLMRIKISKAESALQTSEKRYRSVVETANDAIITISDGGKILFVSHAVGKIFGYSPYELIDENFSVLIPDYSKINSAPLNRYSKDSEYVFWHPIEFSGVNKKGDGIPLELSFGEFVESGQQIFTIIIRDIKERKKAELSIHKVNRALKTLSQCNEILIRASEEYKLLHDICQVLVDIGGYRFAWVGYIKEGRDSNNIIIPIAYKGYDKGFLNSIKMPLYEKTENPTITAIRSGVPCGEQNIKLLPDEQWKTEALKRDYLSVISMPLISEFRSLGVLTLYANEKNYFNSEEVKLLNELANDVAFGLTVLRRRTAHKLAEEALFESEEKFRKMTASAQDAIIMTTNNGVVSYWNYAAENTFGYSAKEAFGEKIENLIISTDIDNNELSTKKLFYENDNKNSVPKRLELIAVKNDGNKIPLELSLSSVLLKGELNTIGIFRDISERKRAENERRENTKKMLKAMQETVKAMGMTVEARDPYTAGHQRRVAILAKMIAEEMNMPAKKIRGIYFAGLIHDMGKIHIPAEILSKPTKLTEIEYALIKTHPQVGYDIIKSIDFPWPIAQMIYQHHERLDGTGYPQGLDESNILIESQVISIADVVESMASHRPYRPSLGSASALEEINKSKGIKYNEEIVEICTNLITKENLDLTKL